MADEPAGSKRPGLAARGRRLAISAFIFGNMVFTATQVLVLLNKRDLRTRLSAQEAFARRNRTFLRAVCGVEIRIVGAENLPPPPYVMLANHQSYMETITLPGLFPPFVWALKESLVRFPFIGKGLKRLEPIAIDRDQPAAALKRLLREGGDKISQGISVLVFPEGTWHEADTLGAFNPGGAALAKRNGVPIVPIAHDTGHFWDPYGKALHKGTVTVSIGEAIPADKVEALSSSTLNALSYEKVAALQADIGN